MKKAVSLALVLVFMLCLGACGDSFTGLVSVYLPVSRTNESSTTTYTYNQRGMLIEVREVLNSDNNLQYITHYTYNERDHLIKEMHTSPGGFTTCYYEYIYSDSGLITVYTKSWDNKNTTEDYFLYYNSEGKLIQFSGTAYGKDLLASLSWKDGKLDKIMLQRNGKFQDAISVRYNDAGQITSITRNPLCNTILDFDVLRAAFPRSYKFQYDQLGRITATGSYSASWRLTYTESGILESAKDYQLNNVFLFDENGCISRVVDSSSDYTYQLFRLSKADAKQAEYLFGFPTAPILRVEDIHKSFTPYPAFSYS